MPKATLLFVAVQTFLLSFGFVYQKDWVFPLLAVINGLAGPIALFVWLTSSRRRSRGPHGSPD